MTANQRKVRIATTARIVKGRAKGKGKEMERVKGKKMAKKAKGVKIVEGVKEA